jgi:hypothetical protein
MTDMMDDVGAAVLSSPLDPWVGAKVSLGRLVGVSAIVGT